jgi:SAM-dependent methyltransferase
MSKPNDADRVRWTARHADKPDRDRPPSEWVVARCLELPANDLIADLACGLGRHARALAAAGRRVIAIDFIEDAVRAATLASGISGVVADLAELPVRRGSLDAVVIVNFLDRSLFGTFFEILRPGGHLVYETYTRAHAALVDSGRARSPRDPAYMVDPGELQSLVGALTIVANREALVVDGAGERHVASVVARKQ